MIVTFHYYEDGSYDCGQFKPSAVPISVATRDPLLYLPSRISNRELRILSPYRLSRSSWTRYLPVARLRLRRCGVFERISGRCCLDSSRPGISFICGALCSPLGTILAAYLSTGNQNEGLSGPAWLVGMVGDIATCISGHFLLQASGNPRAQLPAKTSMKPHWILW